MNSKIPLKWSLLLLGTAAAASLLIVIFFPSYFLSGLVPDKPASTSSAINPLAQNIAGGQPVPSLGSAASLPQNHSGLPILLKIPKINVGVSLESVGLTPAGAVGVPKNFFDAAWFDQGPLPGKNGSAVITGHYGWLHGEALAFNNLSKLQKGDKLYVEYDKGVLVPFVVRELRAYKPDDIAPEVFNSADGGIHLNLITCEGVWDELTKSYSGRLVVFADKQ